MKKSQGGARDRRRHTRKIVAQMINHSRAFIAVMWDGKDPEPTTVIDIPPSLMQEKSVAGVAMEKIAKFAAAVTATCQQQAQMTTAQAKQAQMVELARRHRSEVLQAAAAHEEGVENLDHQHHDEMLNAAAEHEEGSNGTTKE